MPHPYRLDAAAASLHARAVSLTADVAARHAADVDRAGRFPEVAIAALAASGFFGLTVAQMPDAESPLQSTVYLARTGGAAVRPQTGFDGLGLRGNDSSPVSIEGLALTRRDFVSEQGKGADTMLQVILPWFAVGTAATAH